MAPVRLDAGKAVVELTDMALAGARNQPKAGSANDRLGDDWSANDRIAAGQRVLRAESDALVEIARALNEPDLGQAFAHAVALVAGITQAAPGGRVVVSGMGKSGQIARKLAATLASTGTPAFYVHPGEASHGDLGMIGRDDIVLALSNSGETAELSDVLNYIKRHGIKMVAITAGRESTLAEVADCPLVLPKADEACPMGLAPTTSTTMMLGLGDALAIAVMEHRGFTAARFRDLHPGGALGRKLLRVQDLMHTDQAMPLIGEDAVVGDAILEMTAKSFGCVGVTDGAGALVGIITDGDLRRHMTPGKTPGLLAQTAKQIMTGAPRTIPGEALAAEALQQMNGSGKPITSLFVVGDEQARPVGILHIHDCLRAGID